ncbi:DUF3703 domain-containing protein [Streptomyces sp. NPDC004728]|uniref:DUF3703 domain-containing protein n=1 Tax=Streptomyces sp. NPDC004728 TaxID=3154289 RepID=UPI0033BDA052
MPGGHGGGWRAHVLSQPWPMAHTRTHAVMLRLAVRDRDLTEVLGQLVRLAVAGPGSAAGKYPDGNTGRTRDGLTTPMPILDDLAALVRGCWQGLGPAQRVGQVSPALRRARHVPACGVV